MRWLNLEPFIQSEVSQKGKYHVLTHIYAIYKTAVRNPCAGQQQGHRLENRLWTQWGTERVGRMERVTWKRLHYVRKIREPTGIFCMTQGTQTGAL